MSPRGGDDGHPGATGHGSGVDPVTLEVTRNALAGIAEEAGAALRRTAYSPNIKERGDCSTAVFDDRARMVAQAEHIPVHLGSMPASVRAAVGAFPGLGPGDEVLVSDPYAGGTHLPDWTLVSPVHDDDERLLGHVASRAHHADVGGAAPGSMPADATEVYAEGIRIPPVRLRRGGRENTDLVRLLMANTRTPTERAGDLRAQIGANRLAARRLRELADLHGADHLVAVTAATLDHAERSVRTALRALPDGTGTFTDVLEGGERDAGDVRIRALVTLEGDEVVMDLTGSDPQVAGNVNAPRAVTRSCAIFVLRAVIAPDAPANDGALRPLTVRTAPGTVVHARAPAAVAAGNVETSQRIVDALLGALAPLAPERVPAASQGTMNNTLVGGTTPAGGSFTYYETVAGGQGARPDAAGMSGVHTHMTNTRNTPVEALETAYPMRVVEYRLRDGSGGAGRHRGGDGIVRTLEMLTDDATVSLICDRRRRGPWGREGGGAGAPGRNRLTRADGSTRALPARTTVRLARGERITVETPGGGGFGDVGEGPSGDPPGSGAPDRPGPDRGGSDGGGRGG